MKKVDQYKKRVEEIKAVGLAVASKYGHPLSRWINAQQADYHFSMAANYTPRMEQWKRDALDSIPGWKEKYGKSLWESFDIPQQGEKA